jgi:hypothetical protein
MRNFLFVLTLCLMTGCIFVVEESDYRHNIGHDSYDEHSTWFEYTEIDCVYDSHFEESVWNLNALVDNYHGYDDVYLVQVNVYGINDHVENTYNLWEDVYGHWNLELHSEYVYCGRSYDIEFVAYDSFGDWTSIWVQW